jgi:2,3-bisphosphoglycerate-independent phosphoglycerate mutase
MGNSEVGHLNIGAGRIVYQDLLRITRSIVTGEFFENEVLRSLMQHVKKRGTALHLIGLCGDGGVHSHETHAFALLEMAKNSGIADIQLHCLMDGRDTPPKSGAGYVQTAVDKCREIGVGRVASVIGRYYAMDRDNRWERIEKAYSALVYGDGRERPDPVDAMHEWYAEGTTDEFIPPTIIRTSPSGTLGTIRDGDGVVFFNFRGDRAREITRALVTDDFTEFNRRSKPKIEMACMTEYDARLDLPVVFEPERPINILAHILADAGIAQYRISETEKYPHVTYFFNGGVEPPVRGEERFLIPSPKVPTYDLKPEMSAFEIAQELSSQLRARSHDFYVVNFANGDMVGHTGSAPAAMRAVEAVDQSVGQVLDAVREVGGIALITSDHGNCECMIAEDGQPHTAHTSNPVDIIYVGPDETSAKLREGALADIAPTILALLEIPQPNEMTGQSLLG